MKPLVTALCVTRDRPDWLNNAVRCFKLQTFTDSELLIVADGAPVKVENDPRIRVVNLRSRPESLGEKRNIGCDIAGYIIAIWDDDDYHSQGRLADQVATIARTTMPVTAYNKMKFTNGRDWWLYDGILPSVGIGGSLCFTREFWKRNQFPKINEGEDNSFIRAACRGKHFVATAACGKDPKAELEETDLMVATVNRGNTSARDVRPGGNYRHLGTSDVSRRLSDAFLAVKWPIA